MRFNEFDKPVSRRLRRRSQAVDEVIPFIAGAARAGVAGAKALGSVARGGAAVGRGVGKGVAAVGRGVGSAATRVGATQARAAGAKGPANDPNATVGTQRTQGTQGTQVSQTPASAMLKPGQKVQMPAGPNNMPTDFKITRAMGNEVEIENPKPKPGEPSKFVFNKDELDMLMKGLQ